MSKPHESLAVLPFEWDASGDGGGLDLEEADRDRTGLSPSEIANITWR